MNSFINYLDKYHSQLTVLLLGLSLIVLAVFLWVWFYNRRKYHHLKHQIPASVVKNYLDSIIQNSTALKSSLFRGGGLDADANGVPSVMPLSDLPGGAEVNVSGSSDDSALKAEVANLRAKLSEKNTIVKDLEDKNAELGGNVKAKQERIEELEKLLAEKRDGESEGAASEQVQSLSEERDRLQEELKQYDLIADDIADLKRLRQENEQLKKALAQSGGETSVEAAPVEAAETPVEAAETPVEDEEKDEEQEEISTSGSPEVEEALEDENEQPAPAETQEEPSLETSPEEASTASTSEVDVEEEVEEGKRDDNQNSEDPLAAKDSSEDSEEDSESKSPEDLLSEFEKMLG